jgi:transcriptional regulator with XRE-family HTH domain
MVVVNMINFERLKDIREDHDLNQREMAGILNVNRSTYSLWELGINIIPLKKLSEFADYFNFSIDYVLGLTNNKNNDNLTQGIDFKKLGNNLKNLRQERNLSQENIANILNVTQACIAKYEKGLIEISTSNIYKISKEFKISISKLCGKEIDKIKIKL